MALETASQRLTWSPPELTVLAFRHTAAGTVSLQDGQDPGFSGSSPPPSPFTKNLFAEVSIPGGLLTISPPPCTKSGASFDHSIISPPCTS